SGEASLLACGKRSCGMLPEAGRRIAACRCRGDGTARGDRGMMRARIAASLCERIDAEQRARLRRGLRRLSRPAWLGTLRRTRPLSDVWGFDRGTPVDRYY